VPPDTCQNIKNNNNLVSRGNPTYYIFLKLHYYIVQVNYLKGVGIMFGFNRLLKNRYKNVYLHLENTNAKLKRSIKEHLAGTNPYTEQRDVRLYNSPVTVVSGVYCPSLLRFSCIKGEVTYVAEITHKVDCPLFWSSIEKREQLADYINDLFIDLGIAGEKSHKVSVKVISPRHSVYVITGVIK